MTTKYFLSFILLCVTTVPFPMRGEAAAQPRLGINLPGPADWSTELPFVDVFRQSRVWISQKQGASWGKGPELALDEYREADTDQAPDQVVTLLRESHKAELRSYMALGVSRVDIVACACSVCSRGPKRRLPIRAELAEAHIPHGNCRQGYCSCDYLPCD